MIRVLTVDDSTSMRQMIKFTLQNARFDVFEASDGVQACEWAKQNEPADVVLADINMPNMDGLTLLKELRKLSGYQKTPVLMLTTDSSRDRKQLGRETGATGWIVKPFNPDQLVQTIQKVLSRSEENKP